MLLKFAALVPTRKPLKFEHAARADHGNGDMCPRVHSLAFLEAIRQAPVFARQKEDDRRGGGHPMVRERPSSLISVTLLRHPGGVNSSRQAP